MFEVEIAHAEDMLERMESEVPLPDVEREALPGHKRVSIREAGAWEEGVKKKLAEMPAAYPLERYRGILEQHLTSEDGDELSRYISYVHLIVRLLRQLDKLSALPRGTAGASPAHEDLRASHRQPSKARFDVFISHASEDKAAIAIPLFQALTAAGISVWFDSAVLELGDSLRRKLDEGLSHCLFGVVILSPSFLAKEWPQRELDGLVARETSTGEKAILPILHELSNAELALRSPTLADRLSASSSLGAEAIAQQVKQVVDRVRRLE